ncbi:MAG: glycosyltransferase family 2 protein [Candidatus Roizmanbacteria bacterium]
MNKQSTISIVIHTWNEEKNIRECIENARLLSPDIIVVDMESSDGTLDIVKELKVPFFSTPYKRYVEPARNFGIHKSGGDWVFILDADERLTPKLVTELRQSTVESDCTYVKIPRIEVFNKKHKLLHGGWSSAPQIRFIKKNAFINWPSVIHSFPEIKGEFKIANSHMFHYSQGDFSMMVEKTSRYEDIEAGLLYEAKRPVVVATFFRKWIAELYRRMIKNLGFLDGTSGVIVSLYQAYSKTITYLFLYEKYEKNSGH